VELKATDGGRHGLATTAQNRENNIFRVVVERGELIPSMTVH